MRDGIRLALTTYLPDGRGRFPVVVESVPYRKDDDCFARDWQTFSYLTDRGFAGVRIDIRGSGASEGIITDEYTAEEMADTVEVIHWAAEQPWSNGQVGMWGISWGGFAALQTAMLRPRPLGAIVPVHATHDRFATDVHYAGGSVMAAEQGDWPAAMVGLNGLPPDPAIVGDRWRQLWLERLKHTPQWHFRWLRHQHRDGYWLHGSPCAEYGAITCPTLLIGGWLDGYVDGMLAMLAELRCPRRAVIGPWGHYRPATGVPGPTFDHLDLMARWFGHHLRGDDNGVMEMPALTAWIRTEPPYDAATTNGYWAAFAEWVPGSPAILDLPGSEVKEWAGPQWIGRHAPAWDRAATSSIDSSADDAESIVFETEPLAEPLLVLGQPRLQVMVKSDQTVGMVAARLLVVTAAGDAHLLCRGSRNLAFPEDLSTPEPVVPGAWRQVEFPLLAASAQIPAGWRLRIALAGADFPVIWPPGKLFTLGLDPRRSRLLLPTPATVGERLEIPPAPAPPPAPVEEVESSSDFEVVPTGGRTLFQKRVSHRETQPGGLTYASHQQFAVTVADREPASTAVSAATSIALTRDDWWVGTDSTLEMRADERAFFVSIELVAREGEQEIFRRRWSEKIPRQYS